MPTKATAVDPKPSGGKAELIRIPLRSAVYLMDPKGEYVKFFGRISEAEGAASFLPLCAHWLRASVSCREGRSVSPPCGLCDLFAFAAPPS